MPENRDPSCLRVLGMDPSIVRWGLVSACIDPHTMAVEIESMGVVGAKVGQNRTGRVMQDELRRARELGTEIHAWAVGHDMIMTELPAGSKSAVSARSQGVILGILGLLPATVIPVPPNEVKMSALGYLGSKQDMIAWARQSYPSAWWAATATGKARPSGELEHLADATGVIHAGMRSVLFRAAATIARGRGPDLSNRKGQGVQNG
ncbi:MAG: hypothetical protein RJQ08_01705 [Salinisphaeraceae bacterium]|uniref:Holliday junction resolvase RuvC n=1 Tax=Spectribacter acetivorans TaxID=3075603 RepID=A0ABU3B7H3_9GAMM|nr:hypothetical protein [Salinisphaera sp. P385]MDT0618415.1 hypothetical protein [Salinisphaera sp. P385]